MELQALIYTLQMLVLGSNLKEQGLEYLYLYER